jgi:2-oxoglutarate ferredoxin oxidoreductase subunit alpha
VQRGGPSTGLPTKTEQADLLQAIFGRNSEAPMPVVACASPTDAFECAVEACRIAVEYMTPVILLSDGFIANGSEPWKLPEIDELPRFKVEFASSSTGEFKPYLRDAKNSRPWAIPGTVGLQHRVGGLEKWHETGHISYDPENHEFMCKLRQRKVMGIADSIPAPSVDCAQSGDLLVCGWGSTLGMNTSAANRAMAAGKKVGRIHLRHVWPLPGGLDEIFSRFKSILVPELNLGQMVRILRSEYPQHNFISYQKVQGLPFRTQEIEDKINSLLEQ